MVASPSSEAVLKILKTVLGLGVCSLVVSCISTEKSEAPIRTVMEAGPFESHPDPLPNYQPIWIKTFQGEKLIQSQLGYRGWDFNKDQRLDMIEAVNEKGEVKERFYDFDLDGKVDVEEGRVIEAATQINPTNHNQKDASEPSDIAH